MSLDGNGTVESIAVVVDPQPMYNLTVDEAHTFFVGDGDWLVHNSGGCSGQPEFDGVDPLGPQASLLPGEGLVGTYGQLKYANKSNNFAGLNPHHMPAHAFMGANTDIVPYTHSRGITMNVSRARHARTSTFGRSSDMSLNPRQSLARDILEMRNMYRNDGLYIVGRGETANTYIADQLIAVIRTNRTAFPDLFMKLP